MQTMALYRRLELAARREFEDAYRAGKQLPPAFADYIDGINNLLVNVEIRVEESAFSIYGTLPTSPSNRLPADQISSGESELIALAIEILVFALDVRGDNHGLLLLDEPDVHLHPDLQAKLMRYLVDLVKKHPFDVLIATHSTAVVGELSRHSDATVCFMRAPNERSLSFRPIDGIYRELLPVFGAHPLTNVFNETRTLLLEGDDDLRVWQQAVRSSNGELSVTPVSCGGLPKMRFLRRKNGQIVSAVYDDGIAYSLRDRDAQPEYIGDLPPVILMRLSCRTTENLLLSDEVLLSVGVDWDDVQRRIEEWCNTETNHGHVKYQYMKEFVDGGSNEKMGR